MSSEAATESTVRRPRRPKRKLNTPVNIALGAILIAVIAFWLGGKLNGGDDSSAAMPAGMPSMAGSDSDAGFGGFPGASGSGDSTRGEITSLSGNTVYVETSDGTTVKVKAGSGATVTRNAKTKAGQLHPGDTVTVTGKANKAGLIKATDVTATQAGVQSAMPSFGGSPPSGSAPSGSAG